MRDQQEHPVSQPISGIDIDSIPDVQSSYVVGRNGVTRIEACTKSGMYANIPYVRVWADDVCRAEFCQHQIVGVYFAPEVEAARVVADPEFDVDPDCIKAGPDHGEKCCPDCWIPF